MTHGHGGLHQTDRRRFTQSLVLIVDDDSSARDLISGYLSSAGYRVAFASGPAEAMDKARKLRPTLITLDILLRNGSGFGTLYDLKSFAETLNIPVVVISAVDQKRMGKALGAAEYLLKPVVPAELLSITARLIAASIPT